MGLYGFSEKSGGKMGFPSQVWVFPVDFNRKWCRMMESFEAGKSGVCGVFPLFSTPAAQETNRKLSLS